MSLILIKTSHGGTETDKNTRTGDLYIFETPSPRTFATGKKKSNFKCLTPSTDVGRMNNPRFITYRKGIPKGKNRICVKQKASSLHSGHSKTVTFNARQIIMILFTS